MDKNVKIELKDNQTIVFIGDSITDAGRFEPAHQPYGRGYVHFIACYLLAEYPQLNLKIINSGINGDTIRDLQSRWENDCLRHKPDVLSVLIGVNDLWRQHQELEREPEAVYLDEFEATYNELLLQTQKRFNSQTVLIEPFMFCKDFENSMFKQLHSYIDVVGKLAERFEAVLVPMQSFIDKKIKEVPENKWSDDFVHPKVWAHCWLAQRWLEVIGL